MEMSNGKVLLSSAYLGPIQYYSKLLQYRDIGMELNEHYLKQSYRNRCRILTSNGVQSLSIPVAEGSNSKKKTSEVVISYDHPWQKLHWRAILSAYNNAPFFEYYADSLAPFYHEKNWKFLIDFNIEIQRVVLNELNLKCDFQVTETFIPPSGIQAADDFRYIIDPKSIRQKADTHFSPIVYMQVFQEKFGFTPNLSIVDLLFNEGPMAVDVLRKCLK